MDINSYIERGGASARPTACTLGALLLGLCLLYTPGCGCAKFRGPSSTKSPVSEMQAQTRDARLILPASKDGKFGFINERGQVIISFDYDEVRQFNEQLAPMRLGNLWGYVETNGIRLVEPRYIRARPPWGGRAAVKEIQGRWGFIDVSGTQVVAADYSEEHDFSQGLAAVCKDDKWGFIDASGRKIVEPKYEEAGDFHDGLAPVKNDKGWIYIDKSGKKATEHQYDAAGSFSEGLAPVKVGEKWGYINVFGESVVPPTYQACQAYHSGLAAFKQGDTWGFLDKSGAISLKPVYESAGDFSEGLAAVKQRGRWLYINIKGDKIVSLPEGVTQADPFQNGIARVIYRQTPCYISKTGEFVWNPVSGKQESAGS